MEGKTVVVAVVVKMAVIQGMITAVVKNVADVGGDSSNDSG